MRLHRVEARLVVGFLGLLPAAALHPLQPVLAEELGWMRCPDGSVPAREDIRSAVLRASQQIRSGFFGCKGSLINVSAPASGCRPPTHSASAADHDQSGTRESPRAAGTFTRTASGISNQRRSSCVILWPTARTSPTRTADR